MTERPGQSIPKRADSWVDHLANPGMVDRVYSVPPDLVEVDLFSVDLNREGPYLTLRFNLPTYADKPLDEWVAGQANTVQAHLGFFGVKDLVMSGWADTNVVAVELELVDDETLAVEVRGDSTLITFKCNRYLNLNKLSAHHRSVS